MRSLCDKEEIQIFLLNILMPYIFTLTKAVHTETFILIILCVNVWAGT